jgi:DNA repair exonuclease SbcCD ATPase subunit
MQGSAKRNLLMFKKLCGPNALKNIVLSTTMWEQVDIADGEQREAELVDNPEFWGWMVQNGSQVTRHMNNRSSAIQLLDIFASTDTDKVPVVLELQEEMVNQKRGLDETAAGKELDVAMTKEREKLRKELAQTQLDMKEALESRDKEAQEILQQYQREMDEKVRRLDRERRELAANMENLHKEKYEKLRKALEDARKEGVENRKALIELTREQQLERERIEKERLDMERKSRNRDSQYRQDVEAIEKRFTENQKFRNALERKRLNEAEGKLKALELKVAHPVIKTRSHPGKNRINEYVSVALWGDIFYVCGPNNDWL